MLNVILTPNKTCKTKLQCCTSHFTTVLGLGVTDISVSANSESVSNYRITVAISPISLLVIKIINGQTSVYD